MPRPKWAQEVDELRASRGIEQRALAEEVSKILGRRVSVQKVKHWAQADNNLKADELCALADFFGCTPDSILGYTESKAGDKSLQFICDHTGLSDATVSILHEQQQARSLLNGFIDSFLSSKRLKDILEDVETAISCADIAKREECKTDIHLTATLAQIKSKLNDSNFQYDGLPDLPPGTALVSAKGAETLLVDEATKLFREFLQSFISAKIGGSNNVE